MGPVGTFDVRLNRLCGHGDLRPKWWPRASRAGPDLKPGISGGADMVYDGTMYFPNNELNVTGNGTGSSSAGYTAVIARLLKFSGNGSLTFKNPDGSGSVPLPDGLADIAGGTRMALVN